MPAMRSPLWVLAALLLPLTAAAADANLARLQKKALDDPYPEFLATSLVSEVGPRFAGSDGYERAVIWALQKMQAAGLKNIRAEPVIVPHWQRGETRVELLADSGETVPLNAVALGGSVGTLPRGIEAEVIRVESLDVLKHSSAQNDVQARAGARPHHLHGLEDAAHARCVRLSRWLSAALAGRGGSRQARRRGIPAAQPQYRR